LFKKKELISLFIDKLDDPSEKVKDMALDELKTLSDEPYKYGKDLKGDKKLWEQWWNEYKNQY